MKTFEWILLVALGIVTGITIGAGLAYGADIEKVDCHFNAVHLELAPEEDEVWEKFRVRFRSTFVEYEVDGQLHRVMPWSDGYCIITYKPKP